MEDPFKCKWCGEEFHVARDHIDHEDTCSRRADQATSPGNVSSFGAAKFKRADRPAHVSPGLALDAAYDLLRCDPDTENPISHIIVIVGRDVGPEGCSGTTFFQAGSYRHHGQMGLCLEGMQMIRESGQT